MWTCTTVPATAQHFGSLPQLHPRASLPSAAWGWLKQTLFQWAQRLALPGITLGAEGPKWVLLPQTDGPPAMS